MKRISIKLISLFLISVLVFSMGLAGCKKEENEAPEKTPDIGSNTPSAHTLKLPYSKSDKLNPFTCASMLNQSICDLVFDGLFYLDKSYSAKPRIAKSYTASGNKIKVTIGSFSFSDGSKITLNDVLASFNSAKASNKYKTSLANFKEAKIKDNAIEFTLDKPDPNAVNLLSFAITKRGSKEEDAVGSGRYTIVKKNQKAFLKANARKKDFNPTIKDIYLFDVSDVGALKYALAIGNISFAFDDLREGDYTRFSASVKDVLMNNMVYVAFNKKSKDLKNEKVRKAISLLLDRAELADKGFKGYAKPAYAPFNPEWEKLAGKDLVVTKNVDEAIKLLEEAGFKADLKAKTKNDEKEKDKLVIELLVNKDNAFKTVTADNIKLMLSKANITVNITSLKYKDYKKAVESGKYDMYLGEMKLTSSMNLSPILMEKGAVSYGIDTKGKSSKAYESYLNGSVDVFAFLDVFNEDIPFIPLCFRSGIAAYTRSLKYGNNSNINDIYADIETWKFNS